MTSPFHKILWCKTSLLLKRCVSEMDEVKSSALRRAPCTFNYRHIKPFGLCCICKESRATSVLSRMMNESQQITQSLTTMLTWRRQIARPKRTGAFMRERHVGGKIWEFHFSSHAILAHPPTTFVEHSEPWMERWAERRLPLTHPPTVRKFLGAIMQKGSSNPAFMVTF